MAAIKCRNCGRTYRYTGDACPSCGAYNRAPSREYVAPDGTVHLLAEGEKVCYERKECHEDVARQVRKNQRRAAGEVAGRKGAAPRQKPPAEKNAKTPEQRRSRLLMIVGILAVLVPLAMNVISDLREKSTPAPDAYVETEPAEQPLDRELGEVFDVGGEPVSVDKWAVAWDDPSTLLVWITQEADYDLGVNLMAWEGNGMADVYCSAEECFRDGKRMCYVFSGVNVTPPYGARLEVYTGSGTAVIWLDDGIGDTAFSGGE